MTKNCRSCNQAFEITDGDLEFYEKVSPVFNGKKESIPPPTMCPQCRAMRRLAFRNERKLYPDTCDLCGQDMISIYAPDTGLTVYCSTCWYGDGWDRQKHEADINWGESFFSQLGKLWKGFPKMGLLKLAGESINSEYVNDAGRLKNCYLIFDGEQARDSYYGETFFQIADSIDFLSLISSELCYEATHLENCYKTFFSSYCQNCAESSFLLDCTSCRNCFGCVNLHQKQYCIFNKQYTREGYEEALSKIDTGKHSVIEDMKKRFVDFALQHPRKYMRGIMNENVLGDNVSQSKDVRDCFNCMGLRDCRYCSNVPLGANDCHDIDTWGNNLQLSYDSVGVGENCSNLLFCNFVAFNSNNCMYSMYSLGGSHDLFGCMGQQHGEHRILNKQYTKEEYEELVPRIITKMREDGEWGEFFPAALSPFCYNETVAQEYYPLMKEAALEKGFNWSDYIAPLPNVKTQDAASLPDSIHDVPDSICDTAVHCEVSGKPFKIIKQELRFLREHGLPLPRKHPDVRHLDRIKLRNPRRLFERQCAQCATPIQTTYAPDRPERVFCEECYLKEVY